jgi:hypothetical protein
MYALQTVLADVQGTTRHTLLFEYPLDNTCTYEIAFEPLGQEPADVHPLAGRLLLSGPINRALPPRISHSFQNAPSLPKCFQSVSKLSECLVSVCARSLRVRNVRDAELLQFCFKEVTFDP